MQKLSLFRFPPSPLSDAAAAPPLVITCMRSPAPVVVVVVLLALSGLSLKCQGLSSINRSICLSLWGRGRGGGLLLQLPRIKRGRVPSTPLMIYWQNTGMANSGTQCLLIIVCLSPIPPPPSLHHLYLALLVGKWLMKWKLISLLATKRFIPVRGSPLPLPSPQEQHRLHCL